MEKKQGFFSVLEELVVRGLSPARPRPKSPSERRQYSASATLRFIPRRWQGHGLRQPVEQQWPELQLIGRSAGFRPGREVLAPLAEGPQSEEPEGVGGSRREGWGHWFWGHLARHPSVASSVSATSFRRSDLRLLLGVMAAPLAPVHVNAGDPLPHLRIKDTPIEATSAQYILQQYTASTGGVKLQSSIRNAYAMGKVRMVASEFETATKVVKKGGASIRAIESGGFVLWQMAPEMWYVELAVGGSNVHAGSNGKLVWRHTPWLGSHAAKGPVRPLRRALQGLDPLTTASMFAGARCIGERNINGEDFFVLKRCADPQTLKARSDGPAEIIRHVLFGYFSQRTGLLVHIKDSHLTRIQSNAGGDAVYWETTMDSFLHDYRPVEGIMVAHSGRSVVTLYRFGETAMSHTKIRMEEAWTIDEVAFNVAGLSADCFIPPADIRRGSISETREFPHCERSKAASNRAKVAASDKHRRASDAIVWRVEV
ncbi:uncharacterized protein LOC121974585 [Zingiber officinale]|uniref:Uncharacterized protein n=1 Tax=Zingiber officinale TaxID=94328 RepID=A0A8J5GLU2_ZINOF|nr:uncharacterized protein LOC121974585 [Zingiber officinale]KAG6509690.1 hypothetical protein ZIOFF_027690 [Zingiber officinale]